VASASRLGYAATSRWNRRWHYVPPLVRDPRHFVAAVAEIVGRFGYELAFGVGDAEVLQLSANRRRLGDIVPYAPHHQVRRAFDKLELTEVAREVGLSTPDTRIANPDSVSRFDLPIVVKARLHWDPDTPRRADRIRAVVADTRQEAVDAADRMRAAGAEPVFQAYSVGRVLHVAVVADREHQILTAVAHLTTRLGSSETGQSARAVTVPLDADLRSGVQAFLTAIGWFGLADLQFWLSDDNEALLTDFNGRIYGGLALPYASGMRPIDAWARLATGRNVEVVPPRIGVRYQAMEGDLRYALGQRGVRGAMMVAGVLSHSFRSVHPIWSWSDPRPALTYLARLPSRAKTRVAGS
jgi:hypothetical protein